MDYTDNYRYSAKMGIYIPSRTPDSIEDTHGGFHGDGESILKYRLSQNEIEMMERDILVNKNWKAIDDISAKYLYGGIEGYYTSGFTLSKIPKLDDGYFCFYDKQTRSFQYPNKENYSSNYIIAQYSPNENILYIFELDT